MKSDAKSFAPTEKRDGKTMRTSYMFYAGQDDEEDDANVLSPPELTLWRELAKVESPSHLTNALNEAAIPLYHAPCCSSCRR